MQFSGKIGQIIGLQPPLGLVPPPLGNPGSATPFCFLYQLICFLAKNHFWWEIQTISLVMKVMWSVCFEEEGGVDLPDLINISHKWCDKNIWVFHDRRFCQIIWQIWSYTTQNKFRQKMLPVGFELTTSRSSVLCSATVLSHYLVVSVNH